MRSIGLPERNPDSHTGATTLIYPIEFVISASHRNLLSWERGSNPGSGKVKLLCYKIWVKCPKRNKKRRSCEAKNFILYY
jgi:hypothetical protein